MPTIDVSMKDLNALIGKDLSLQDLEDKALLLVKGENDGVEGDTIKVDCKDSNRPDLWSTEGMARVMKPHFTDARGIPDYPVEQSEFYLHIDRTVDDIRPYMVLAIAENVTVTDEMIRQLVQLQEKICMTFGRKRKVVGGGIFDLDLVTGPLTYKAVKPTDISFAPLGFEKEMTLKDVLQKHPKGIEYAHLLKAFKKYPVLVDANDKVLTMPPITNSNESGKITEKTKNLLIEMTGTNLEAVRVALRIFCAALADRGAIIKSVTIDYGEKKIVTPDFSPKRMRIKFEDIEQYTGMKFSLKEMKTLLEKYNYNVKKSKYGLEVEYPSWRQDILHPMDVIEDILISYGYNDIEPIIPKMATVGDLDPLEVFSEKIRNAVVGFGAQEILTFTLSNDETLFTKMNRETFPIVEIANPVSAKWSHLRNWLLPSLIEFFAKNVSEEYPQQVYEVGDIIKFNENAETGCDTIKRLAWALADKEASFTKAKQMLDYILTGLGLDYTIEEADMGTFIPGRCGKVMVKDTKVAYIGEVHPQVLENFGISFPICAFELHVSELQKLI